MSDQPNILVVCTDQQYAGAMSCAGNTDLDTPGMDQIAQDGVRFENTYCTNPICSPARASLFTGRMPRDAGVSHNREEIDEELRDQELGNLLDDAGYDCGYGGKWHLPTSSIGEGHGFEKICGFNDVELGDACIDFIERERDRPFFLVASFDNPHNICEWARNQPLPWGPIPDVSTDECPNLPKNFAIPPYEPAIIRETMDDFPETIGAMRGASEDEWRQYRHAYYRLVEKVDADIVRMLGSLEEQGIREETVVIFTSDHGDGHGAHQCNQKLRLYEEMVRVPFLISYPGETASGLVDDTHLVSNGLDLLPTICDYAEADVPGDLPGASVRPLARDESVDEWRDQIVIQTHFPDEGRAVRTDRYKYIVYERGRDREQLFDMEADPGELVDLAYDADHQGVLDEHRERLLDWCTETSDIFAPPSLHNLPSIPGHEYEEVYTEMKENESARFGKE